MVSADGSVSAQTSSGCISWAMDQNQMMPSRNKFSQYHLSWYRFDIFCYYNLNCILSVFFPCLSSIYTLAIPVMVSKADIVASDCKGVKESYIWQALAKKLGVLKVVLIVQTVISLLYYFLHNLHKPLPFVTLGIPGAKSFESSEEILN